MTGPQFEGSGDVSCGDVEAPPQEVVTKADVLRALAGWLDAHPGAELDQVTFIGRPTAYDFGVADRESMGVRAREIGGRWEKDAGTELFKLRQEVIPGVDYVMTAARDQVCERVVTGTREVERPDPDAPLVTVTEEIVEWRCGSLLGATSPVPVEPEDVPF